MNQDSVLLSRRLMLAGLGAGALGAVAAAAPVLSLRPGDDSPARRNSWWDRGAQPLHSAGFAEWSGLVGETFALNSANGSHLLSVVAVTAFAGSGSRPSSLGRSEAFSVVFELTSGPSLPLTDRLYELVHASYPRLSVFMSAPFALGRKVRSIAVFN